MSRVIRPKPNALLAVGLGFQGTVAKDRVRFVRGHSAWSPGQLQGELDRNQVNHPLTPHAKTLFW